MKNIISSQVIRKSLLFLILSSFLAVFIFLLKKNNTWELLTQIEPLLLIILTGIAVIYIIESALSTKILLHGMGFNIPFMKLYNILTVSMFANYTTPTKIGTPIRIFFYKKFLKIPVPAGSASIALEFGTGIGIAGVISFIGVIHLFKDIMPDMKMLFIILLILMPIMLILIKFIIIPFCLQKTFANRLIKRIVNFLFLFKESIIKTSKTAILLFGLLLLIRIFIRVITVYIILLNFNYELSLPAILYAQTISGLIGIFSMLPMGLGAKDLSLFALLLHIGVPANVGTLIVAIDRAMWTLVPLVLGIISGCKLGFNWIEKDSS
ncbi:Lysylphosphatidylglycerol synthetase family protein [Candidatus Magnetomoraceae bacterium gMMP-15]